MGGETVCALTRGGNCATSGPLVVLIKRTRAHGRDAPAIAGTPRTVDRARYVQVLPRAR
jgi:hypothetical protein